jgi:dCTP deaminase
MTGVLSDAEVLAAIDVGHVLIHPFDRAQLSTSSYDVRLGEWYYREQVPPLGGDVFNVLDQGQVAAVWGDPQRAERAVDALERHPGASVEGVGADDRVIMLAPGESILAHTQEFIGGRAYNEDRMRRRHPAGGVTTMMKARSSIGRCSVSVCSCAGWGDVGYVNRWTMEIHNRSRHFTIPLVVGTRVAQIVFLRTGALAGADYTAKGAYAGTHMLDALVEEWRPEMMLPKMRR